MCISINLIAINIQYKKLSTKYNNIDQITEINLFHVQLTANMKVWQGNYTQQILKGVSGFDCVLKFREKVKIMQLTLISESGFCIRTNSAKCFYDLCVQRMLVLILRVFQERSQLHLHSFQQLKIRYYIIILQNIRNSVNC